MASTNNNNNEKNSSVYDKKLDELHERYKDFRNYSINHLTNTTYILITLASGLFALIFNTNNIPKFNFNYIPNFIFWFSLFLLGSSIISGIFIHLTRAYDFRISRNIAQTRKRFYEKFKKDIPYKSNLNKKKKTLSISHFAKIIIWKN